MKQCGCFFIILRYNEISEINEFNMYTLSMFNTGQVTLPKKWRSQFRTNKFIAKEDGKKLILEPLEEVLPEGLRDENIEIYDDGEGIRFKKGLKSKEIDYLLAEFG